MGRKTEPKLTSRERLTRGLHYTAVGPVDITRGVVGISAHSAEAAAAGIRRRAREARAVRDDVAKEVAKEAAAVKQVVAELPQALQEARKAPRRRRRRLLVFGGLGLAVIGGAAALVVIRRSSQPEPSALPPSVEVTPKL
ncbi:cell wall synthesis protein CwsA [Mycolicibacterium sp. CBM1]